METCPIFVSDDRKYVCTGMSNVQATLKFKYLGLLIAPETVPELRHISAPKISSEWRKSPHCQTCKTCLTPDHSIVRPLTGGFAEFVLRRKVTLSYRNCAKSDAISAICAKSDAFLSELRQKWRRIGDLRQKWHPWSANCAKSDRQTMLVQELQYG